MTEKICPATSAPRSDAPAPRRGRRNFDRYLTPEEKLVLLHRRLTAAVVEAESIVARLRQVERDLCPPEKADPFYIDLTQTGPIN